jgi:hypothetical protein
MRPVSSATSMVVKYVVDNIIEDTPCWLHVPFGWKGKIVKVAEGIVMVGRTFHNAPIASDCAKVQVFRVIDDQYLDTELDYPNEDEAIEKLQDVVNNFILWDKRDIFLKEKVAQSPPMPKTSPLTHDKEVPPLPETQPRDKEVPLLLETHPHDKEVMSPPPKTQPNDKEAPPPPETQPHDKEAPPPPEPQPHEKEVYSPPEL